MIIQTCITVNLLVEKKAQRAKTLLICIKAKYKQTKLSPNQTNNLEQQAAG